ncbi:hypothetical protein [Streptomyces griseoluteus]|uniref:hypothetical protein n=1 Tax=Streptomyces griseoluteus TaxID=29306 RepID=UPI00367FB504
MAVTLIYGTAVALTAALPPHGTIRWWGMTLPPWGALALIGVLPLLIAVVDVYANVPVPVLCNCAARSGQPLFRPPSSP